MSIVPIEKQIEAVEEQAKAVKESYTTADGTWDDPWIEYEYYCLKEAIETLKKQA